MLNLRRLGTGEPLLLLHGIGMQWQWWTPCLEGLAAVHDVVAVDFPGFGGSAPLAPGDEPTPVRLALAVEELCGELGVSRPHVAGISLGGLVALELAKQGAVASACAISPAGFWRGWERTWAGISLRLTSRTARALAPHAETLTATALGRTLVLGQLAGRPWRVPASELAGNLRATAASQFDRTLPPTLDAQLTGGGAIDVPVTIAWGTRDRLLPPRQAERAVELIPTARRIALAGCGHVPTYDDPAAVVRAIRETASAA